MVREGAGVTFFDLSPGGGTSVGGPAEYFEFFR